MTMLPFSLLEGDDRFSITHPFLGFRFCVFNHVSAPKLLSLINVTCPMNTRTEWGLSSSVEFFCTQCAHTSLLSSSSWTILCTTQWMSSSLAMLSAERVCMPRIICSGHAWSPGHYLSASLLPLLKAMHRICLVSWYYTYSIHLQQLAVDFHWCNTHQTHKSKHTFFKVCHNSSRPSIFNLIYLWYPPITVQWHNLQVPITSLNLQSHDTISCQTCCYLIFWNFLVHLSEAENSKCGTSTTGMHKDMPLILNNNYAFGVTDEVRKIT